MFEENLTALLGPSADPVAAGWQLRQLAEASQGKAKQLVEEVATQADQLGPSDPAILGGLLRVIHTGVLQLGAEAISELSPAQLQTILEALPSKAPNRYLLLQLLAMHRSEDALRRLVLLLDESPPAKWMEAAQVLSPLMQHADWPIDALFPAVLDGLQHAALASPLLDLANYLYREERVSEHPGKERLPMLNHLLGEVSGRLSLFEENPRTFGDDVDTVQAMLGEAVALAVSLCDTVGLIGDETSIGKLNQTIELKHRRVQCEAAGALAKLGDELGKKRLLDLTEDPAARLRAIHYADEIGFGDLVNADDRSDTATAEAEMALWLCQPQQMGVPPTSVEVIESKRLLWPSFNDPVDVFLVRFEYNFGDRTYSNVGVTGPVVFAMSTDVANLPIDDIYAIYAGWHAEHEEIFTVQADQFNEAQKRVMESFEKHLEHLGYRSIKPALLGIFLDEQAGTFTAVRDATECVVITDNLETIDHPISGRLRPLSPDDLFNLYKGRKMLRTFNSNS
ncbi:MAG: HEAT repeat domain-containing protein [Rubripirellula sp.]